jgi:hypothetical protein
MNDYTEVPIIISQDQPALRGQITLTAGYHQLDIPMPSQGPPSKVFTVVTDVGGNHCGGSDPSWAVAEPSEDGISLRANIQANFATVEWLALLSW